MLNVRKYIYAQISNDGERMQTTIGYLIWTTDDYVRIVFVHSRKQFFTKAIWIVPAIFCCSFSLTLWITQLHFNGYAVAFD